MLSTEEIIKRLGDRNLKAVSENTGIPYPTLRTFLRIKDEARLSIIKKLSDYLEGKIG